MFHFLTQVSVTLKYKKIIYYWYVAQYLKKTGMKQRVDLKDLQKAGLVEISMKKLFALSPRTYKLDENNH